MSDTSLLFSPKDLRRLILPLIGEQLLSIFLGMADIVMVSTLGEEAVSGVSLVDSLNVLLVQLFAALGTGGAVVASQYIGHGAHDMASKTAKQLLYTIVAASLAVLVLCLAFNRQLLSFLFGSIDDGVMSASRTYFFITIFALPSIGLYNACAALFRAQGNSRVSMLISLLINVLNIGGNAILLYGFRCGVEGVAFPTLVSRTAAAAVLLALLYRGGEYNGHPAISIRGIFRFEFDGGIVKRILAIGVPNGLENSMFQIGKILVLSLIATYGTTAIAANAAANTLASFGTLPGSAMSLAMLTVVGQCIGAGEAEQAEYYTKKLLALAFASMAVLNVPFLLSAHSILRLYALSPETTRLAWYMTLLHGVCAMLIWPVSFTFPNSLRAAGDAVFTMIVSMISMWVVRIGMSYVLKWTDMFGLTAQFGWPLSFGALGVWFAMILDWIVRSSCFVYRFRSGKWKQKRVI
ncbi:MATE family efflux transporter [Treponema socranskii subsp. buccale]|uniref:MATE family efflux transporter n=1 Tax=Treponema socranskii TaxID=53419 RepID=UPI0020A24CF7|nr:MATE family efflux transporter [Treponema socranskii]UTD02015.1 MATE family efflux transporter [Treponema socranskii subsp. buccale]